MIAQPTPEVNSHRPPWRQPEPTPEPITAAVHGPTERADYVAAIEWSFAATADEILERHHHRRDDSPGWRLGVSVCRDLLFVQPEQQSDDEWIIRCCQWRDRLGDAVAVGVCPPLPWDRDQRALSRIFQAMAKSEAAALWRGAR
ncbi:hypothetical protein [Rhodopirellula europaea]|uniref:hypothetical protein n=2 Tax=Rhodopirellula TaxID=265488 RepID=UPI0030ED9E05